MSDNKETNINNENANMMEQALENMENIKAGQIVKGEVVSVSSDGIMVNVGYKSEGVLSVEEFSKTPEVGAQVEVLIQRLEDNKGRIKLSKHKADFKREWEQVIDSFNEKRSIKFKIIESVKGGYRVRHGNVAAFLPYSQLPFTEEDKKEELIGKEFICRIIELNRKSKNIVVSNKLHTRLEKEELMKEVFKDIKEGDIVKATVSRIVEFGAFLEYKKILGLLHRTDMKYSRVRKVTDICNIGDELEVIVLKFDLKTQKVSFGLKQKKADPWSIIDEKYNENDIVEGKVKNITDFGVFLELEDGVEGLLHISDFSWTTQIRNASEIVNIGEIIKAKVLKINKETKKISLGMKQLVPNPWEIIDETYTKDKIVKGKVKKIVKFGCFVALPDGVEGLVHISDMSWYRMVKHPSEIVKEGEEIDIKILEIDKEKKKISLGIKQITEDPWEKVDEKYKVSSNIEGKIVNITKGSVFVELEKGIDGRIGISELSWTQKINHPSEVVSIGDNIKVKVIDVDKENKRISLSLKQLAEDPWDKVEEKYKKDSIVEGKVKNIASFGAFVELEEGVEGLIHISDLSWTRNIRDVNEFVQTSDIVKVKILNVDNNKRKISLGLKQVTIDPLDKFKENSIVQGIVLEILDVGAIIEIEEGISGFVHISQVSEERIQNISEVLSVGDSVQVKIIEIDNRKRNLKLSIKQADYDQTINQYSDSDEDNTIGAQFGNLFKEKGFIKE